MESEFVAASEAGRELLGVRETLSEIGESPALPMKMLIDNQAAIRQIEGEASSTKSNHVDVRVKYLCDNARRGIVVPQYVPSDLMLADVLTKALDAVKTVKLRSLLHIV
uniref:Polyprotein n=1 Tax=Peronospora matthiolae TaxID=2874970 RepID=A0AAV1UES1_9STRA